MTRAGDTAITAEGRWERHAGVSAWRQSRVSAATFRAKVKPTRGVRSDYEPDARRRRGGGLTRCSSERGGVLQRYIVRRANRSPELQRMRAQTRYVRWHRRGHAGVRYPDRSRDNYRAIRGGARVSGAAMTATIGPAKRATMLATIAATMEATNNATGDLSVAAIGALRGPRQYNHKQLGNSEVLNRCCRRAPPTRPAKIRRCDAHKSCSDCDSRCWIDGFLGGFEITLLP